MDASQYLRRKREAMSMYVKRELFQDAGFRSEMIGKQAATFIANPASIPKVFTPACNTSSPAQGGSACAEPVKPTNCCVSRADLYTTPGITTACCPFQSTVATYLSPCKVIPYQGTTAEQSAAVGRRVNREMGYTTADCCSATNNGGAT